MQNNKEINMPNKKENNKNTREEKMAEKKEIKKMQINREYQKLSKEKGNSIIPPIIHYTQLVVQENKKNIDKKGELYIQLNENDLDKIRKITEEYNINPSTFIDMSDFNAKYDLDDTEEDNTGSKQNLNKTKEAVKEEEKPKAYLNVTYDTIVKSLKKYDIIPEKYHHAVAICNLSIQEYIELINIYNDEFDSNETISNMSSYIYTALTEPDKVLSSEKPLGMLSGGSRLNIGRLAKSTARFAKSTARFAKSA